MSPPNVLVLMSDEYNPRFLQHRPAGEPVTTPQLSEIAEQGVDFQNAYCPYPICAPSRKCMLTGQTALDCGAAGNNIVYGPDEETLVARIRDAGFETCLVGKMHFNGQRQFNGYQHRPYGDLTGHGIQQPSHQPDPIHYDDLDVQPRRQAIERGTRIPSAGVTQIPESLLQEQVVARESIAWLREHRAATDDPWLLTASFSRPHFPLTAPRRHIERYWDLAADEPTDRLTESAIPPDAAVDHAWVRAQQARYDQFGDDELAKARACYFACVDFLDEVIGEFLATLAAEGFLENTIVVYVSDHGDMAGEHGLWWKGTFHEGSAGIPMHVQLPEHRNGTLEPATIHTPVSLIDLFPTLCGQLGVPTPDSIDGVDLSEAIETGEEPDRDPVICDNLGTYRMVRDEKYKYVQFSDHPELLFDLEADPEESQNLATDATGPTAAALERLRPIVDEALDPSRIEAEREAANEAAERHALGIPPGTGNAYVMPDGRLVDAGTPLYKPDVLADAPSRVFADWPTGRDDGDPAQ